MLKNNKQILVCSIAISTAICSVIVVGVQAAAGQLSLEPPPSLVLNGPPTNFTTADEQDRDIDIDPGDALPANGTVTISTALATDMDINEFPPVGVSVIIQNDTITVTNHTVEIGNDFTDQAVESTDDSDGDEDQDEE